MNFLLLVYSFYLNHIFLRNWLLWTIKIQIKFNIKLPKYATLLNGKKKKKRKIQLPQIHISKWITPELYLALSPIPQSLHQTFTPANIFSFCITTADSINWGQDWQNKQTNKLLLVLLLSLLLELLLVQVKLEAVCSHFRAATLTYIGINFANYSHVIFSLLPTMWFCLVHVIFLKYRQHKSKMTAK